MDLKRNFIIGVTGGIAAYKTPILIRRLKEQGANVKAVMTESAGQFITALTLQAVSGDSVRDNLLDAEAESGMDHIELARWADAIVIAPASANFIAKLAHGIADNLLSTLCLATSAKIYVAPAMNQQMWRNPATRDNITRLIDYGMVILGPAQGDQACGETGPGRMLEPTAIIEALVNQNGTDSNYDSQTIHSNTGTPAQDFAPNLKILITAGPTWEALDPVRGFTNHSSGKMGYHLAGAFASRSYNTTLISGPTALKPPAGVNCVNVVSAQQMYHAVHQHINDCDIFISVAAVADYRPELIAQDKIKKSKDTLEIKLVRNPDILKSITQLNHPPFAVGFAAETDNVIEYAKGKLADKNLDMIIANQVGSGKAFGQDHNELTVISRQDSQTLGPQSKQVLSDQLVSIITKAYADKHPAKNS